MTSTLIASRDFFCPPHFDHSSSRFKRALSHEEDKNIMKEDRCVDLVSGQELPGDYWLLRVESHTGTVTLTSGCEN